MAPVVKLLEKIMYSMTIMIRVVRFMARCLFTRIFRIYIFFISVSHENYENYHIVIVKVKRIELRTNLHVVGARDKALTVHTALEIVFWNPMGIMFCCIHERYPK